MPSSLVTSIFISYIEAEGLLFKWFAKFLWLCNPEVAAIAVS